MAETEVRPFTLNFGPQHPAAHGVLRLVLELDEHDSALGYETRIEAGDLVVVFSLRRSVLPSLVVVSGPRSPS